MAFAYPRLLHPVPVIVEQVSIPETAYDLDAREPVQQAARLASVTIPGQAKYGSSKELSYESSGPQAGERGYVLFRQRDLDSRGIVLAVNDRITKVGRTDHDSYITRLEPTGHYAEFGGNTLVKAYFADRQPSKHRRAI
jgi:hypothetical protein